MKEIRKIKQLKTELKNKEKDLLVMKSNMASYQRQYDIECNNIKKLKEEIIELDKDKKVKVSEHAIVRYFERVKGYSISDIEKEILSDNVLKFIEVMGGNGGYPNKGFKVIMKNYTVTTIV